MRFERELEASRTVARRAGELALGFRSRGLEAETKPDLSPVTAADRAAERLIATAFEEAFPGDGLLGEEGASKPSRTGRRWIIDPLDGTRDFLRGNPTWSVLLALETGGELTVGVCYQPEQDNMYSALQGGGAWWNGKAIRVSGVAEPGQSLLCVNSLNNISRLPFAGRLLEWMDQFWCVRSLGGSQDAMLVASGRAEAWIAPEGAPWDLAALKIITEEAGAVFFNFDGGCSIYRGNAGVCVPGLEAEMRRFLGAKKADTNAPLEAPL
jgi:fructose-1,6-bisphosphatase/inositol monophosphatase family enzyme